MEWSLELSSFIQMLLPLKRARPPATGLQMGLMFIVECGARTVQARPRADEMKAATLDHLKEQLPKRSAGNQANRTRIFLQTLADRILETGLDISDNSSFFSDSLSFQLKKKPENDLI